jgi:hypothetical protein
MNHGLGCALVVGFMVGFGAPCGANAQTARTADGIRAFVQGDYANAVEILKPAAERWQMPFDNTAAFFMALMYDNGLGVAQDSVRACALLLRAVVHEPPPPRALTFIVQALAEDLKSRLTPEQTGLCLLQVDNGFETGSQPVTFTLAPGHWLTIEDDWPKKRGFSARIEYGGKQSVVEVRVPLMPGGRVLPFNVTELTTLRPAPAERHFLEAFSWIPAQANRWTLMWSVFEIVRDTLVEVTFEELQTVGGERPPDYETSGLRRLANVRVNADGDAEWVVSSGAEPRNDVIETDAERQEVAAARRERAAAEKAVDWTVRRPIDRAPSLAFSSSSNEGCMGPVAYGWSSDRTEAIVLSLDRDAFSAVGSASTFVIGQAAGVRVAAHVYDAPQRQWPFCSDVRMLGDEGEGWRAVSGTVTIELAPVFRVREPGTYRATIRLSRAEFISATGARVRQSQPIILSTLVRLPEQ